MGRESANPDGLYAEHDDHLYERSRADSGPESPGQLITDPMYNPNYSNFCYTTPFMPGSTSISGYAGVAGVSIRCWIQSGGLRLS